ncbi:voltage-dependent T-type calcium channel subunit alpha-1H-like [Centruroides sculpturatus]|uniref:voltage-dependent T-type calcium channel subunit alpha-1H-like n=1 Tax=Centruroides sculpturatus TaxID=218467 RepID=UPI000C6EBB6F|nr:voltage-dependent T-type calcium channel subunit alpha-1H-like [Centruroides sculpturatus]
MYQPCSDDVCESNKCKMLQIFDDLTFTFFAFEMVVKITAMGFTGKGSYMGDSWNRLDGFIIVAGCLEYCLDVGNINLSAIRTIRVLRPLRAINRIPSMRILVMLLLDTLPMLGNVLLLCFFVFFIFGIVGVQLWAGLLRQRCYLELPPNVSYLGNIPSFYKLDDDEELEYICSLDKDGGMHRCANLPAYEQNNIVCNGSAVPSSNNIPQNGTCVNWNQYYTLCRAGDRNPFQGAISFDNIGLAWVAIFLVISLEGWSDIMYYVQDAHSFWDWIYFVLLIVIGSFFMINLCLVVIATQFSETKKREMERMRLERARFHSNSTLTSNSASEPTSCYTEIIKYLAHLWRRARRKFCRWYRHTKRKRRREEVPHAISLRTKRIRPPWQPGQSAMKRVESVHISENVPQPRDSIISNENFVPKLQEPSDCTIGTPTSDSPPAPCASPEISDIDPVASPRRPTVLKVSDPEHRCSGAECTLTIEGNGKEFHLFHIYSTCLLHSCLGMYLFGGKLCTRNDGSGQCNCEDLRSDPTQCSCDRKQFDNILWATVTVFQVRITCKILGSTRQKKYRKGDDKKKSDEVLENTSPGRHGMKGNKNRKYMIQEVDPKDNIEKETIMRHNQPDRLKQGCQTTDHFFPPIITHTAATPQGSPCANLDPVLRDLNNRLSPSRAFNISASSIDTIDKSSIPPSLHIQQCSPSQSTCGDYSQESDTLTVPQIYVCTSPSLSRKSSLASSKSRRGSDSSYSEKKRSSSPTPLQRQNSKNNSCSSPKVSRRGSIHSWKLKKKKKSAKDSSIESDSDSLSDEEQEVILNNMNNQLNCGFIVDHRHCNGRLPTLVNTTNNKTNNVTIENTISTTRTPSPQYSIKNQYPEGMGEVVSIPHTDCCSRRRSGSVHNSINDNDQNPSSGLSLVDSSLKEDFKPNNLSNMSQYKTENTANAEKIDFGEKKLCWFFEWTEWMKDRESFSLFLFSPSNRVRKWCTYLAHEKWFDYSILVFIGLNCITLAMERPNIPPNSTERMILTATNYIFTVVFAFEMLIKVIAKGLWYGSHAYFKTGWNIMDGSLVMISLVDVLLSFVADGSPRIFGILRVFRLLRSLRPLRVINRAPGLKLVVQTLLSSLRPIGNIVLICCTFFIIFGILGVQLFKGSFYYCEGPDVKDVKNKTQCLEDKRNEWINQKYNFDNLGQALMSLFVLSSKDGWVNIMYTGLDAVGIDQQPIENYSEWRLLYFISFLLLVAFFVLNMFVGVVVENFHRCREEQEKEEKARRAAKRARKLEKKKRSMESKGIAVVSLPFPFDPINAEELVVRILKLLKMAKGIRALLDTVMQALPQVGNLGLLFFLLFFIFAALGVELFGRLECTEIFPCQGLGEHAHFRNFGMAFLTLFRVATGDNWNGIMKEKYDVQGYINYSKPRLFTHNIITSKYFDLAIAAVIGLNVVTMATEFYMMPTSVVLKLLKMAKGIRALLDTVMQALPQVGNLGLLFFLLFFIFAALGVELFGRLECTEIFPCQGLGEHAHFRNFGMAFLTLFRVATGDNWNGIMKDTLRDNCDSSSDCIRNCCVSPIIAPLYFVIFVLMAQFVLVNVVVAVLMKHLEESHKQMDDDLEMDVEIERELAAEAEARHRKAARVRQKERGMPHRTLVKMSSLPANFTFTFQEDTVEPSLLSDECGVSVAAVTIEISEAPFDDGIQTEVSAESPLVDTNVNIKRLSPEDHQKQITTLDHSLISIPTEESPDKLDSHQKPQRPRDIPHFFVPEANLSLTPEATLTSVSTGSPTPQEVHSTFDDDDSGTSTQCLLQTYPELGNGQSPDSGSWNVSSHSEMASESWPRTTDTENYEEDEEIEDPFSNIHFAFDETRGEDVVETRQQIHSVLQSERTPTQENQGNWTISDSDTSPDC